MTPGDSGSPKRWVVVVPLADGPTLLIALFGARVSGLRVVELRGNWYFRLPSTRAAWACWHGFVAGRNTGRNRKRMGYTMGSPALCWPPRGHGVVRFPTQTKHETP